MPAFRNVHVNKHNIVIWLPCMHEWRWMSQKFDLIQTMMPVSAVGGQFENQKRVESHWGTGSFGKESGALSTQIQWLADYMTCKHLQVQIVEY